MFEYIISLIAPYSCLKCGSEGPLICKICRHELPHPHKKLSADSALDALYTATTYDGAGREIIHALKFAHAKAASRVIAQVMHDRLPSSDFDWVTHVPTASSRVRARGYDQAALIACHFATMHADAYASLLRRQGQQRQLGQDKQVRQAQIRQAFYVPHPSLVQNKHILLIDDVITTGATIEAAAKVLRRAGAAKVDAYLFAMA
jgi:ComF family protein